MKVLIVLAALVACALASGYGQAGFRPVHGGYAAPYRNADRQRAVNQVAAHVGAGTGTAKYYGVPGAEGHYGHGYGYDAHHNGGYGQGSYGHGYGQGNAYGHGYGHANAYGHGYGGYGGYNGY